MSDEYPRYFYKYRSIRNIESLEKDYAIDALINNQAIFSSRANFNDLFDSKIELIRPVPRQIKDLKALVGKDEKLRLNRYINNGKFTSQGLRKIGEVEKLFNKVIDSYPFLSVSKNPESNLMWSHYAGSHNGFCIEFKSEFLKADKVAYQKSIPKLEIIDMLRVVYKLIDGEELGRDICSSLKIKLNEWEYESEYRFLAGNSMGRIPEGKKFIKVPYDSNCVESIIFGCRMPDKIKEFIIKKMPAHIKFKQAVARVSTIEITNSDLI